eukprot:scpid49604/ scgid27362/ Tetratricopeptide repeat protein 7A
MEATLDTLKTLSEPTNEEIDYFLLEARLLQAKVLFLLGQPSEALACLDALDISDLQPESGWPIHATRLVAECLSLKGWALQHLLSENTEWREQAPSALTALQQAVDVTFVYLQELSVAVSPSVLGGKPANASNITISSWLEAAVHHAPLMHLLLGRTDGAIQVLRNILRVSENQFSKALRLSASRQLALLLLRAPHCYTPPDLSPTSHVPSLRLHPVISRPNFLSPEHQPEEVVLVLTIAEGLVREEAVQSRFPDDQDIYKQWHDQVAAVYDLAVLALAMFGKSNLIELLQQSMRFSFDDEHVWMQFGLALISGRQFERALMVLKQCLQQNPDNTAAALLVCQLRIYDLPNGDEAVEYASQLAEKCPEMAKAHVTLGLAYAVQARQPTTHTHREELLLKAMESFRRAYEVDQNDPACMLYYALHLAIQRRVNDAMLLVLDLLQKSHMHHHGLWLMILLQTSLKNYAEALSVCEQALYEYPQDMVFVKLKVEIKAATSGVSTALVTAKSDLNFDADVKGPPESPASSRTPSTANSCLWLLLTSLFLRNDQFEDAASCFKRVTDSMSPDSLYYRGRLLAHELRLEDAKTSYLGALATDPSHVPCMLALTELHLEEQNLSMAEQYISQVLAVDPGNHQAWRQRGSVLAKQGEHERAADCFVNALQLESFAPIAPFSDIPLKL